MIEELKTATEALKNGKLILFPTDTVWALGCDVRDEAAVQKIQALKNRESRQPGVIMIAEIGQLYDYVQKIPEIAWDIVEFAEKPLIVIYPTGKNVAPGTLGADGSIGIQLVKNEFCQKLIRKFGRAIVYSSANKHKQAKPRTLAAIDENIVKNVDYVVKQPQLPKNNLSEKLATIIRLELNGQITFIRK